MIRTLASDVPGEFVDEESRDRNAAYLVGLRRAEHRTPADVSNRLDDLGPSTHEVEAPHPQGGQLAEAHACVGKEQDHESIFPGRLRELLDMVDRQENLLALRGTR